MTTLPRSTPAEQGVDPAGITAFIDALESTPQVEPHSIMVLRHGVVVAEGWWAPYAPSQPQLLYSLSKSFASVAAGIAAEEGLLDLDATVLSYFPEFDADIVDERSRRMLVRHVAAMASGHLTETLDRAVAADPLEPVRGFLLVPPDQEPGSVFAYNQPCTYALAAIVQRQSGQTLTEYLRPRLLDPLGIGRAGWQQAPPGRDLGFTGLHITTESVAAFGQLLLQRGRWGDRQLVPEHYLDEATRAQIPTPDETAPDWAQGYGFQFWIARHGYRGDGAFGQFCIVLPEHDAVVVITQQSDDTQAVLDAVWEHLLPAIDAAAPDVEATVDPIDAATTQLRERLGELTLPVLAGGTGAPFSTDVLAPFGGRCDDQPSLTGIRLVDGAIELHEGDRVITAAFGDGAWGVREGEVPVAASAAWHQAAGRVDVVFLETPHRLRIEVRRDGSGFRADWQTTPLRAGTLHELRCPDEVVVARRSAGWA